MEFIIEPIVTEAATQLTEKLNRYTFRVSPEANKFQIKDMDKFFLNFFILYRENDLHTTIKITWHPVCTSHVDLIGTTIMEIENPAVLQEIADNGTHMDIFTESRNSGLQAADPPDDQLDFNACAGGLIKSRNNLLITQ